jgi:hypothetical protein
MCIVCKDWEAGKLSSKEAIKNLGELIGMKGENDKDPKIRHYYKAVEKILDKEVPVSDSDEELNRIWHDQTHED